MNENIILVPKGYRRSWYGFKWWYFWIELSIIIVIRTKKELSNFWYNIYLVNVAFSINLYINTTADSFLFEVSSVNSLVQS